MWVSWKVCERRPYGWESAYCTVLTLRQPPPRPPQPYSTSIPAISISSRDRRETATAYLLWRWRERCGTPLFGRHGKSCSRLVSQYATEYALSMHWICTEYATLYATAHWLGRGSLFCGEMDSDYNSLFCVERCSTPGLAGQYVSMPLSMPLSMALSIGSTLYWENHSILWIN